MTVVFQDWQLRKGGEALKAALEKAGDAGIPKKQALELVRVELGTPVAPSNASLGILCRYARVRHYRGVYYLVGRGPREEKGEKQSSKAGQTLEFEDVTVVVKRKGLNLETNAKKVIIFLTVLIGAVFWLAR